MMSYRQKEQMKQLLDNQQPTQKRAFTERPRDDQGKFTTKNESLSQETVSSSLFNDDPHWQWVKTSERTYELKWRLTSSEQDVMILTAIFGVAAIIF
ncbi:hypothetical protein [Tuberibacillus sp. Marseille-P3662]|uniref:hypothetical protein n=1 Tax=Tuberibacillus sp. Marseille-P3662 TaxID=1965358 RepID=UPI00111BF709|nr:hypothetical protein [Tuberibacillus sp. Marseille-P3662]